MLRTFIFLSPSRLLLIFPMTEVEVFSNYVWACVIEEPIYSTVVAVELTGYGMWCM